MAAPDRRGYPALVSATLRLFAAARAAAGTGEVRVSAGNLEQILEWATIQFPALSEVLPRCSYLVDGIAVHATPSQVQVCDGAEVDVLPPFAGG